MSFNLITAVKALSSNKVIFRGTEVKTSKYKFQQGTIQPITPTTPDREEM